MVMEEDFLQGRIRLLKDQIEEQDEAICSLKKVFKSSPPSLPATDEGTTGSRSELVPVQMSSSEKGGYRRLRKWNPVKNQPCCA